MVGGFETLTAMENVESDPKTDRPKVRVKQWGQWPYLAVLVTLLTLLENKIGGDGTTESADGITVLLFCFQEEIRIETTTVFVDPYEEADAQVSCLVG